MALSVGDRVKVFDPKLWGYKDQGNNMQFYKEATVLAIQGRGVSQTATVKFDHDGRESSGHFTYGMKLLSKTKGGGHDVGS